MDQRRTDLRPYLAASVIVNVVLSLAVLTFALMLF